MTCSAIHFRDTLVNALSAMSKLVLIDTIGAYNNPVASYSRPSTTSTDEEDHKRWLLMFSETTCPQIHKKEGWCVRLGIKSIV